MPGVEVVGPDVSPIRPRDPLYWVRVPREFGGHSVSVGADDGQVYNAIYNLPATPDPPVVPDKTALAAAVQFLREHYPPFQQRRWQLSNPAYWVEQGDYMFAWFLILNEHGALGPWWISVVVDGATGRVRSFGAPLLRIRGPTIPRVPLSRARAVVDRFLRESAHRTMNLLEVRLEIEEDEYGSQALKWMFFADPRDPESHTLRGMLVDASTGKITRVLSHGFGSGSRIPDAKVIRLASGAASSLCNPPAAAPVIENGAIWLRAEVLRAFGAKVDPEPGSLRIAVGAQALDAQSALARFRDGGWWVPLRHCGEGLGWRVDWLPAELIALVTPQAPR